MYIADAAESNRKQSLINMIRRPATVREQRGAAARRDADGSSQKGSETPVVVELSQEGKSLAEQVAVEREPSQWEKMLEKMKQEQAAMARSVQKAAKSKKKKRRPYGDMSRALAIARRIMKGEKVPPKDESFLFRYNSDLYLKAKSMAMQTENPKKHKSLLEELEEEQSSGCSGAAVSSAATPPDGAEEPGESESPGEEE